MRFSGCAPARPRWSATIRLFAWASLVFAVPGRIASSQAWVAPKGEGFFSLSYQNLYYKDHLTADTNRLDVGHVRSNSALFDVGYGLFDRLALNANVSFVDAKWEGNDGQGERSRFPHGANDDGAYHGSFQDARLTLRYALLKDPVVLTPLAGIVFPARDYDTQGHSAIGRGFVEAPVGFFVGKTLEPFLPDAYLQARYAYSFVEGFQRLNLDRSNLDVEIGYFLPASLTARLGVSFQRTYGGFNEPEDFRDAAGNRIPAKFAIHDRVARSDWDRISGGLSYAVNGSLDVYATGLVTVGGANTVSAKAFSVGLSWSWGSLSSIFRCRCS